MRWALWGCAAEVPKAVLRNIGGGVVARGQRRAPEPRRSLSAFAAQARVYLLLRAFGCALRGYPVAALAIVIYEDHRRSEAIFPLPGLVDTPVPPIAVLPRHPPGLDGEYPITNSI